MWHKNQWVFSVVDVIEALTGSTKPRDYWYQLKKREVEYGGIHLSTTETAIMDDCVFNAVPDAAVSNEFEQPEQL